MGILAEAEETEEVWWLGVVTTDCVITGEGIWLGTLVDVAKPVAVVWVGSEADTSGTDLVGWVVDAG